MAFGESIAVRKTKGFPPIMVSLLPDMLKGDTVGPPVDNLNDCSPAFRWIMRGIGKLYGTDRHEDAEALFSQAIRADPSCSTAYHMRAVARIKLVRVKLKMHCHDILSVSICAIAGKI